MLCKPMQVDNCGKSTSSVSVQNVVIDPKSLHGKRLPNLDRVVSLLSGHETEKLCTSPHHESEY